MQVFWKKINNLKSFEAEPTHHFIVLVFQDVAMPDISAALNVEWEWFALLVADFDPGDCD